MSDRLADIRARLRAALRGPWFVRYEDRTEEHLGWRADVMQAEEQGGCRHGVALATGWSNPNPEAELIAHAPDDLAFLLAEVATAAVLLAESQRAFAEALGLVQRERDEARRALWRVMEACGASLEETPEALARMNVADCGDAAVNSIALAWRLGRERKQALERATTVTDAARLFVETLDRREAPQPDGWHRETTDALGALRLAVADLGMGAP